MFLPVLEICGIVADIPYFLLSDDSLSLHGISNDYYMTEYEHSCYDYLFLLADKFAPEVDADYEYVIPRGIGGRDFIKALITGKISFRFTKEEYNGSVHLQESIRALGLDAEKLWYAILFAVHFTESKFIDAMVEQKPVLDQMREISDALKMDGAVLSVKCHDRLQATAKLRIVLNNIARAIDDECERQKDNPHLTVPFYSQDPTGRASKVSATPQMAFATRMLLWLFGQVCPDRQEDKSEDKPVKKFSRGARNRMMLASRIMFLTKMTSNKSFLINEEAIKGILSSDSAKDDRRGALSSFYHH